MRYFGFTTLVATTVVLGACNKGEHQQQAADSTAMTPPAAVPPADAPTTTTDTSSAGGMQSIGALRYTDLVQGTGDVAKPGMHVMVLYTGWLMNGKKFDSSVDRNNPFEFQLGAGQVIQGWDTGVAGMRVGGKRRLIIPPELGYGDQANDPIPANSTLKFDVELVGVKP